jgi:excinuclease ABC subunit A
MKAKPNPKLRFLNVTGAKLHNLKNVDVSIPRNRLTVITGVSGSGKSSLAFDTIYAEGQRRFVESLSSYARQFLERMQKPDCDTITGLPPAIAIEQNTHSRNPRSTVGTSTEIYDYFRLLFGRIGKTICYSCGNQIYKDTPQSVAKLLTKMPEGTKLYITFPPEDASKGTENYFDKLKQLGFFRFVKSENLEIVEIDNREEFESYASTGLTVLVDRTIVRNDEDFVSRVTDSLESAFTLGNGKINVYDISTNNTYKYTNLYECPDCDILYEEPDPRLFSFNNPHGACPKCQGFGRTIGIDEDLVFPDRSKSIMNNAIHPFKGETLSKYLRDLMHIAPKYGIDLDKPIADLSEEDLEIIWNGKDAYIGINGFFNMLEEKSYKMHYRVILSRYRGYTKCKACNGSRIRTSARQVYVNGKNIPELIVMSLKDLKSYFSSVRLNEYDYKIAERLLDEINHRLTLLNDIGLEYINLARLSHTLSGGESQRISLATALGSALVGTLYVLDEPSIGLHPRDTMKLIKILLKIRNLGNTVIVVEHDPDVIKYADYIIDMGPGAGEHGGEVVFNGNYTELLNSETSLTGRYFSNKIAFDIPKKRRQSNGKFITVTKAKENNLKIESVSFPVECITAVTGVSGSGKSTLVKDIVYSGIKKHRGGFQDHVGKFESILGFENFDHVEMVDQTPIGKSSRSTPATFVKVFDIIRDLYASAQASKQMGWKAGHFSFNVAGGRCETCEGEGFVTIDMQFMSDVSLLCESCRGTRFKKEVLEVRYEGKNIVDVLNMSVETAIEFFKDKPRILKKLKILEEVGLGYLKLGQPSTMLSGGEAQRIKLASHLDTSVDSKTLFILDEPTTGLHVDDIATLNTCFHKLADAGNTLIIIEHNLHVIASADYVIDLGPEAGDEGGFIVAQGSPEAICEAEHSHTAKALKEFFKSLKVRQ